MLPLSELNLEDATFWPVGSVLQRYQGPIRYSIASRFQIGSTTGERRYQEDNGVFSVILTAVELG